jgi:transcriptional repressor NrdR
VTRRRSECEGCGRRYTTYERIEQVVPWVVKKDQRREPFDRAKVLAGLRLACVKRPVPAEELDRVVTQLERELVESGEQEVASTLIGEKLMGALRGLDRIAYVRFASVYRDFKDVQEFVSELSGLASEVPGEPPG